MIDIQDFSNKIGNNKRHSVGVAPSTTLVEASGLNIGRQKTTQRTQKSASIGISLDNSSVAGYRKNSLTSKNNAFGIDNDKNRGSG